MKKINLNNILIVVLIGIVLASVIFIVGYLLNKKNIHPLRSIGEKVGSIVLSIKDTQDDSNDEEKAKNIAVKKFKELGEKNIKSSDIEVIDIQRKGEKYYYMATKENSVEIRQSDNKITRINNVSVEQ